VWATPIRRLALSVLALAVSAWILKSAVSDPHFFDHRRAFGGFLAAPALAILFGAQAVQAIMDLAHRGNSPAVFIRLGRWLDGRRRPAVGIYVAIMLVAYLLIHS
jgi:hypothetical protein